MRLYTYSSVVIKIDMLGNCHGMVWDEGSHATIRFSCDNCGAESKIVLPIDHPIIIGFKRSDDLHPQCNNCDPEREALGVG